MIKRTALIRRCIRSPGQLYFADCIFTNVSTPQGAIVESCSNPVWNVAAARVSLFAGGLSIDSHAYVISQHARWPTRTPRPTCANQDDWVVITPKRPKANSIHTATWHAWKPPLNIVRNAVIFPPHLVIVFGHRAILIGGGAAMSPIWWKPVTQGWCDAPILIQTITFILPRHQSLIIGRTHSNIARLFIEAIHLGANSINRHWPMLKCD